MLAGRSTSLSTSSRVPPARSPPLLPSSSSGARARTAQPRSKCTQPTPSDVPAAIWQLLQGRTVNAAEEDIVVAECQLVHEYLTSTGRLPTSCRDAVHLAETMRQLTDVAATGADFRTLQMLKRHPGLLKLDGTELAGRVLQLKMLLPQTNVADLIYQRPSLLLLSREAAAAAIKPAILKLEALMPGIPIQRKLHEGGTIFWSFASLLPDASAEKAGSSSS